MPVQKYRFQKTSDRGYSDYHLFFKTLSFQAGTYYKFPIIFLSSVIVGLKRLFVVSCYVYLHATLTLASAAEYCIIWAHCRISYLLAIQALS